MEVNKGIRIAEQYNTFLDTSYGKKSADPYVNKKA